MKTLISFLLVLPVLVHSQVSLAWMQDTEGIAVATDSNNNVYTVSYEFNPAGDIILTKRDTDGNFIWNASFNNTDNTKFESATWVVVDSQDNIYVSGTINSGFSNPVQANSIIMKFGNDGNLLWRQVYEATFDGSYTKKCILDSNDNIYVLGMGTGPSGFVTTVKKFNTNGVAMWSYFDSSGIGAALNIKFTPDNHLLIIGRATVGSINGYSKIDLDGNNIWNHAGINSYTTGDSDGDSVGNTYLVNGEYIPNGGTVITKLGPDGSLIWENIYTLSATRVEVGTDDLALVCGYPNSAGFGTAFAKTDASGNILWYNMNADGAFNLLLHAQLLLDQFNNAYLAAGTLFEMAVCKVNSDGTNGWMQTVAGGYANSITIGNDYNIYVTGGNTAKFAQDQVFGCIDPGACNYIDTATSDDGSCEYISCSCPGDLDGNNTINTADLLAFFPFYGCTSNCGASDLNNDTVVNTADLLLIISYFGVSCL